MFTPPSDNKQPELFSTSQECIRDLRSPSQTPDAVTLLKGLSVTDLNGVHQYLGIVGSFNNISPLHHQEVLQRKIVPTQACRLHLVWFGHIILIKPLPDCLLNAAFFKDVVCRDNELYALAIGFLYSYCRLVESSLDLPLAQKLGLLNAGISWETWYTFRAAVLNNIRLEHANRRWQYGELRLGRLNLIWRATGRGFSYFTIHREYATYFDEHFRLFIAIFALVAIILQAMQNIVTFKTRSDTWGNISYGFSFAAVIGVVVCLAYTVFAFLLLVTYNLVRTVRAHRRVALSKRGNQENQRSHRTRFTEQGNVNMDSV
jgi:hypothetical protein